MEPMTTINPNPSIEFVFPYSSRLDCMAPKASGGSLPQGMGINGGFYIILNDGYEPPNRYAGQCTNMRERFTQRLQAVAEIGLTEEQMRNVIAFWGPVPNVSDNSLLQNVDLEHLLIRFVLVAWSYPHTVTNRQKTNPYFNPTSQDISVTLRWEKGVFEAGGGALTWVANSSDEQLEFR